MHRPLWPRRAAPSLGVLELAPLIDCVFLILMFFVVVGSSGNAGAVPIEVPRVGDVPHAARGAALLTIGADDAMFWEGELVSVETLSERLRTHAATSRPLRLAGDHRSSLGTLMRVYQMCRAAGVARIDVDVSLDPGLPR